MLLALKTAVGQQGFAFTHLSSEDGTGLASNSVNCIYQDEKGYIWVGTANGLQRFDGGKFIDINTNKAGSDLLQHVKVSQIIPADSGKLMLAMFSMHEFGLFDPSTFTYKKLALKPSGALSSSAQYRLWKSASGEIYLTIAGYGILHYHKASNSFIDDHPFPLPERWKISLFGFFEDVRNNRFLFVGNKGLCIYDQKSRQMWTPTNNPKRLGILTDERAHQPLTEVYVDKQQRTWLFGWDEKDSRRQQRYCFDKNGHFSSKDTAGLNSRGKKLTDTRFFYETSQNDFWMYGYNSLIAYDRNQKQFSYILSGKENLTSTIDFEVVYQIIEDHDRNIWIATNSGLYYTGMGKVSEPIVNVMLNKGDEPVYISDICEVDSTMWFTTWFKGVITIDRHFRKVNNDVYRTPPPSFWPAELKRAVAQTTSIANQKSTGKVWIGCAGGILLIYHPNSKTTVYLHPPETNNSMIRYIAEDKKGNVWIATDEGRIIKWDGKSFTIIKYIETITNKIYVDDEGWLWLGTRDKGLFAMDPETGKFLQHFTSRPGINSIYSNAITDVDQLQDKKIVFGAGALQFFDKKTGLVDVLTYEDGLPSNSISRLRADKKGFLWIITTNGLCRYNPANKRITPFGKKDGVVMADKTITADYITGDGMLIFGGSNAFIVFYPSTFASVNRPPGVTITEFKVFNKFLPVDSLMGKSSIRLMPDQNSISIYFSCLSYLQRDKLTYYYKMEGIDKDWMKADGSYSVNYSQLPSGLYIFRIYSENLEGVRSEKVTELSIYVKPPFYKTWWFLSCVLFVVALIIYEVHNMRVNRLLAVETLRNRVARDLHDDMGSTLSTINILSAMAKTKMNVDNSRTGEYLVKISEYSEKMMDAMDDIVWSIKPSNDSMQKITARMREFATNVLEAKEIEFELHVDEEVEDVKLNMEARRDFFLVFKEAVNNAAKYSNAAKVLIQLTMQNKKLVMLVKDNGQGFDMATADGNGLGNMSKRAENLNGSVSIQSKKDVGTSVRLVIPIL